LIETLLALKGGPGKTTTTAYLSAARYLDGRLVAAVDGDDQGSLLSWAEKAEFPWLTIAMPTKTIHLQVSKLMTGRDDLVIDTPPTAGTLVQKSAVRAAVESHGTVIIPVQPTLMDYDQFGETVRLVEETAGLDEVRVAVLLTRVVSGTRTRRQIRDAITGQGIRVLDSEVRQLQSVAIAHGSPITDLGDYAAVYAELKELSA